MACFFIVDTYIDKNKGPHVGMSGQMLFTKD